MCINILTFVLNIWIFYKLDNHQAKTPHIVANYTALTGVLVYGVVNHYSSFNATRDFPYFPLFPLQLPLYKMKGRKRLRKQNIKKEGAQRLKNIDIKVTRNAKKFTCHMVIFKGYDFLFRVGCFT